MLGGALAIVLTPLATFAGFLAGPGRTYPEMPWARLVEPLVTPFLGFGAPEEVYATYGKAFFPVYLLFLIGLVSLHARISGRAGRLERRGFQVALVGLAMNLIGNIGDYWLGEEVLHQPLWGISFVIGTLLGTLVYMVGSVLLGIAILRMRVLPRWSGWALILAPTLGIVLGMWLVEHVPSAFVLPVGVGWMLLGYALWSEDGVVARRERRVS
jgi:hypothetical protein